MELLFSEIKNNIVVKEENEIKPEETIKKTSTKYVKKFIERNKDKLKEKKTCEICLSTYTHFNKYAHNKTKRHQIFLNKLKEEKN
jgi:hypothetical protein